MQIDQILFSNLLAIAWSAGAAGMYAASTLLLGARLAPARTPGSPGLDVAIHFSLGAAAFGLLFSVLAMLRLAYTPVVLVAALLPLAMALYRRFKGAKLFDLLPPQWWRRRLDFNAAHIAAAFGVVYLACYPLALALAWPRGGDMAIYHLVIPRTVLWNHGLVFNPFSHDAGLYYGWQLYALPAYLMGGDIAFQFCSFIAFAILLFSAYGFIAERYTALTGLTAALVVAGVTCGMIRESVVNNDIPLVLLELALLGLASVAEPRRRAAWMLGLLGGFVIAVKLVAVAAALLAGAVFLWRAAAPRPKLAAHLFAATLLSLAPWPVFDYLASGSPLPHFLLIWPPETGYLPQYVDSISYLMRHFGEWYQKNFYRLFSEGMEFLPVLLIGLLAIVFARNARSDRLCLVLAGYAVSRSLLLLALNRFDMAMVYHDRYHLTSYVLLALAGMLCWRHALEPVLHGWPRIRALVLSAILLAGTANLFLTTVSTIQVMGNNQPDGLIELPSMQRGLDMALARMGEFPGGGAGGIGYDAADEMLPGNAVVATTVIDPYLLQRPFLQMLPVSENVIDLSLPPEKIRDALLAHGATHLHLTQHTGLNAWMIPVQNRWLQSLRKIPALPGVRRLLFLNYWTDKGLQGFFALASPDFPKQAQEFQELRDINLTQAADGTWMVRWRRDPGGEVRVIWRNAQGRAVLFGEAASEVGFFPIRLRMPEQFSLRVICFARGRAVQAVELAMPPKQ